MDTVEIGTEAWARQVSPPFVSRYMAKSGHNPDRCCASVASGGGSFYSHQCSRKPVSWFGALGYCKAHDPLLQKQKREARYKAWDDEYRRKADLRKAEARRAELGVEAAAALRSIADGHNDPRSLASEILAKYADIA